MGIEVSRDAGMGFTTFTMPIRPTFHLLLYNATLGDHSSFSEVSYGRRLEMLTGNGSLRREGKREGKGERKKAVAYRPVVSYANVYGL
jgi:hypothetical protein